jgi:hypothetical protein
MVDAIRGPPRRNRSRKFPTFYDPPLFCASLLSALAGHFLRSRNRPKAVIRIPFAAAGLRGLRYTGHGGCLRSSYTSDCHLSRIPSTLRLLPPSGAFPVGLIPIRPIRAHPPPLQQLGCHLLPASPFSAGLDSQAKAKAEAEARHSHGCKRQNSQ